jgi:glycine oxidase
MRIGIAGAGLLGRLLAWRLSHDGHAVTVCDPSPGPEPRYDGHGAAAFSAAGMLSPTAELDHAPAQIAELGWRSIALWRDIVERLGATRCFAQRGSLLVAHRGDAGAARRVLARLAGAGEPQPLDAARLRQLEPALHGVAHAWLLPDEAQIDPPIVLQALQQRARDAQWRWGCAASRVERGALRLADGRTLRFDIVYDVRGTGARPLDTRDTDAGFTPLVRGVRGETVWLQAPDHGLTRPVRLLHPRHRVYLVPRGDIVFVGATEIESEDRSPVSLRSAVELMAAAHSVMPALAEARIVRLDRNLRPALPDHLPRVERLPGLVRINGLFRHGWLVAPALIEDALAGIATANAAEVPA